MALTATVTKVSVNGAGENEHLITLNLKVNDGAMDVIDQDFTITYKPSHDDRSVLRQRLITQMQKVINAYKSHNTISESVALGNDITTIQSSLIM